MDKAPRTPLKNLDESAAPLCPCGRAPKRPSQRNCRLCHAEANRRYRASLKKQSEALKRLLGEKD